MHVDLNPCGGAEQVALATLQALIEMGIDVELALARNPHISRLKSAFGDKRIDAIFSQIKGIDLLDGLLLKAQNYDNGIINDDMITINTHGDMLPYYLPHFSKTNAITYCHYPLVAELVEQRDLSYANYLMDLGLVRFDTKWQTGAHARPWNKSDPAWCRIWDSYVMMLTLPLSQTLPLAKMPY